MNEVLFLGHASLIAFLALCALRQGRSVLISWIALQAVMANLFVIKQIEFLCLTVTCGDVFAVGGVLGLNLLQEFYGKAEAKKVITATFMAMLSFALMAQLHLSYEASPHDHSQGAFHTILAANPRIMLASFVTFFIIQRWDLWFFAWLRERFPTWPLAIRTALSLFVAQFFDTVLFTYLGLYGLISSCLQVIIFSYGIKLLLIVTMAPFTSLCYRFLPIPRPEAL